MYLLSSEGVHLLHEKLEIMVHFTGGGEMDEMDTEEKSCEDDMFTITSRRFRLC